MHLPSFHPEMTQGKRKKKINREKTFVFFLLLSFIQKLKKKRRFLSKKSCIILIHFAIIIIPQRNHLSHLDKYEIIFTLSSLYSRILHCIFATKNVFNKGMDLKILKIKKGVQNSVYH